MKEMSRNGAIILQWGVCVCLRVQFVPHVWVQQRRKPRGSGEIKGLIDC